MRASPGAGSCERGWEFEVATSFKERRSIVASAVLVESTAKEKAGFIRKQWIDARDEGLSLGIGT